ncbi:hypothetical protein ACJX0J_021810, partial [Zea mays]
TKQEKNDWEENDWEERFVSGNSLVFKKHFLKIMLNRLDYLVTILYNLYHIYIHLLMPAHIQLTSPSLWKIAQIQGQIGQDPKITNITDQEYHSNNIFMKHE